MMTAKQKTKSPHAPILVVDDQAPVRELLASILSDRGHAVTTAACGEQALELLEKQGPFSLVILDIDFGVGKADGLVTLRRIREQGLDVPVIMLTGQGTIDSAVEAVKLGAADYLEKDAYIEDAIELSMGKMDKLLQVIEENRRLSEQFDRLKREADYLKEQVCRQYNIVGDSPQLKAVLARVERVADVPRPVLIRGERGTGKELVAAAIHAAGSRRHGPFVVVNCAAIPEGLLECELFGQEEDAYNNAPFKLGRFDIAAGGTLFLDEIGNMGVEFQRKILRVIEYHTFERVQGTETITTDARIVAATNRNLEEAMAEGSFRADLYDRISFETIELPPLRDRRNDIPLLTAHFIDRFREEVAGLSARRTSDAAIVRLKEHDWPGNVRELKNVVERAAYRVDREVIEVGDLAITSPVPAPAEAPALPADGTLEDRIAAFERAMALDALDRCAWNQRRAAELLGLKYDQFRHLYRKHDLGEEKPVG